MKITSLDDATSALLSYSPARVKGHYTLDNIRTILERIGNPQAQLKAVHIAGTSGKTSTCYAVRDMCENSGLRTGLTVSPHISGINERLQIAGAPMPEGQFVGFLSDFLSLIEGIEVRPT